MADTRYRVVLIDRPAGWEPVGPDDAPPGAAACAQALAETSELLAAVEQGAQFNQQPDRQQDDRWAVVVDPDTPGRRCEAGRLCTPIGYRVVPIWWPDGWEPGSALDVPNCAWRFQESSVPEEPMRWEQALATVRGLNQQCLDAPGSRWFVVVAVENEPLSQTVSLDASGVETVVETRRLHVIRPEPDRRGECVGCPARAMPCAAERWTSQAQEFTTTRSRPGPAGLE